MRRHLHLLRRQPARFRPPAAGTGPAGPAMVGRGSGPARTPPAPEARNWNLPTELVMSMLSCGCGSRPGAVEIFHLLDKVLERAAEAIQAPDDQGVAGACEGERLLQPGRSALAPLIWSVKTEPTCLRASTMGSRTCWGNRLALLTAKPDPGLRHDSKLLSQAIAIRASSSAVVATGRRNRASPTVTAPMNPYAPRPAR